VPAEITVPGASVHDVLRFQALRGDFGAFDDIEAVIFERAMIMRTPGGYRYERRTSSGRYVEFTHKPLADGSLLGVFRDITKLKERELERPTPETPPKWRWSRPSANAPKPKPRTSRNPPSWQP